MKAKCKRCGTLIAADTHGCGTNGLKNHTISCLKKLAKAEVGDGQTILSYSVDGGSRALTTWKFDRKTTRLGLCKMILLNELLFLFVERITSHKSEDIGAAIVTSLTEWGLTHLFSCTLDNALQNDVAIGVVKTHMELMNIDILGGKYFHMRCVVHILNLIVKDGLKEIGISIRRVRETVRWLKSSPQRWGLWAKVLDYLGDKIDLKKKLCMNVPTQWNSTYLMLESAIPYAEAFTTFGNMNSSFGKYLRKRMHNDKSIGPPEEEDWVNVKKMISYLKKFHSFTQIVSVTKRPTSHLFFTEMCGIFDLIRRLQMSSDYEVSSMASRMRLKIGKYWMEETELNVKMNKIIYMAVIFDPR
ncbi:hypothetical protein AAHA92_09384 [Salvia divinorum]|uniref:hAT-like transposase RNase-H fold domain-containing protein n=1 Tax=Salvia divinorum TaxID=28513 RepID=A0ABD1HR48_SALDI